jgi:hypothetical protein
MRASRANIERAHAGGAVIFAVCAGFQLIGTRYDAADGQVIDGAGLVDLETRAGSPRLIGEVVVEPTMSWAWGPAGAPATLTGFENHGGRTTLGEGLEPLGTVLAGGGNGTPSSDGKAVDGLLAERLVGTYLHGPVLPRNPQLADRILGWVTQASGFGLPALDSRLEDQLHDERVRAGSTRGFRRWMQERALARG